MARRGDGISLRGRTWWKALNGEEEPCGAAKGQ